MKTDIEPLCCRWKSVSGSGEVEVEVEVIEEEGGGGGSGDSGDSKVTFALTGADVLI